MQLDSSQTIKETIKEAEYVLIGIGEEWTPSFEEMLLDTDFSKDMAAVSDIKPQDFALDMCKKKYLDSMHSEQLKKAYRNLFMLCKDKNYFLISVNQDAYPVLAGFEKENCVFPCGNFHFLQCEENCRNSLLNADEEFQRFFAQSAKGAAYEAPVCPFCKAPLVFNRVEAKSYCEGGYLEQWQSYRNFLTQTVNRKLCILELGVSMRYPGIIRNAFERTMIYSQKATLFRIHHSLSDLPELIRDRSYAEKENSVYYMSNLFVS